MRVSGTIIRMAMDATEYHCSQVQGFYYRRDDGVHRHVIRDLTRQPDAQEVWSIQGTTDTYDVTHASMMEKIEDVRAGILADRINRLIGATGA